MVVESVKRSIRETERKSAKEALGIQLFLDVKKMEVCFPRRG